MTRTAFGVCVLGLLLPCAAMAGTTGYETFTDWLSLANAKTGQTSYLASSYDQSGGNEDWNWYAGIDRQLNEVSDNGVAVTLLDVQGAGALTRYWMPHATANDAREIRITIDAGTIYETTIVTDTDALLYGGDSNPYASQFTGSLVPTAAGGQTSYEPIAFTSSLKVESINRTHLTSTQAGGPLNFWSDRHYYQLNYTLYDDGRTVTAYSQTPSAAVQAQRTLAETIVSQVGQNPAGASASTTVLNTSATSVAAGDSVSLATISAGQSGTIRRLNLKMGGASDADLANLRLRVRYDGSTETAIDVPVGAFFGQASAAAPGYQSLPMGTESSDGFYCYFPMPYRDGVEIELYNAGGGTVAIDSGVVEFEAGAVSSDAGYLHAVYNESNPGSSMHRVVAIDGEGHYVGHILTLSAPDGDTNGLDRGILESDETIVVDGTIVLQGTGLEDAFNGGFYYNHVLEQDNDGDPVDAEADGSAFAGLLWMDTVSDQANGAPDIASGIEQVSQYRWMLSDLVAFEDGLTVDFENYGGQSALFASTAFYYVTPEPTTIALLLTAAIPLLRRRR